MYIQVRSRGCSCRVSPDFIHCLSLFFFFKQKTAYEMRISDWSSDVCSSDLEGAPRTLEKPGECASSAIPRSRAPFLHPRKLAETLDAPVREVCIQNVGSMRSIAAPRPCDNVGRFRHDPSPPPALRRRGSPAGVGPPNPRSWSWLYGDRKSTRLHSRH